jgi:hypothetical protein
VKLKSSLLCGVSVIALMATPAAAQQIQQSINGGLVTYAPGGPATSAGGIFDSINSAVAGGGTTLSLQSFASQQAANDINVIGGPSSFVSLGSAFQVQQSAGVHTPASSSPTPIPASNTNVNLNATNTISATTTSNLLSTTTVGGSQSGLNTLNLANFRPSNGSSGTISQTANMPVIGTNNTMTASSTVGPTSVDGQGGVQSAGTIVNSASVALPTAGFTAEVAALNQVAKAPDLTSTNTATATVTGGVVDPTVKNLGQVASIDLNAMKFFDGSTSSSGVVSANAIVGGEQLLRSQVDGLNTVPSAFKVGNLAKADAATSAAAGGPVSVSNVAQGGSVNINSVSGGAGTNLTATLLSQTANTNQVAISGTGVTPVTTAFAVGTAVVNAMQANTNTGSATITGPTGLLTQSFAGKVNSVSTGGSVSGDITQSANDQTVKLGNLAEATTSSGRSVVSGVTQSLGQSFNTVNAGGSASSLMLNQTAGNVSIATNNRQAATGTSSAQIGGGAQLSSNAVNVVK